jgi:hypothetical protein
MDVYVNDHLKMDSDARVLFYPKGFSAAAYLIPDESLMKRIVRAYRLYQILRYVFAVLAGVLIFYIMSFFDSGRSHRSGSGGGFGVLAMGVAIVVFYPLEYCWNWYVIRLAAGLEKVHD